MNLERTRLQWKNDDCVYDTNYYKLIIIRKVKDIRDNDYS
jgi:hypothetical protein